MSNLKLIAEHERKLKIAEMQRRGIFYMEMEYVFPKPVESVNITFQVEKFKVE